MKRTFFLFGICIATGAAWGAVGGDWVDRQLAGALEEVVRPADPKQGNLVSSLNWVEAAPQRSAPAAAVPPNVARPLRVLLDPGHGGEDRGAVGWREIAEKTVALRLARLVKQGLVTRARTRGVALEVRLTRDEDVFVPLAQRSAIANEWEADLFVSIHLNASPVMRVRGFEVYFMSPQSTDEEASRIAKVENGDHTVVATDVVQSILSDLQLNRHVTESSRFAEVVYGAMAAEILPNKRGVRQAPFAVLSGTQMPALLVEVGYVTHPDEAKALQQGHYLKRVAGAISTGIVDFAASKPKPRGKNAIGRQAAR